MHVEVLDKVSLRHAQRVPQLLIGGLRRTQAQVGGHGAAKQVGLLRDKADTLDDVLPRHVGDIGAVEKHASLRREVEARDEGERGGLAGTGRADKRGGGAGGGGEGDVVKHGRFGAGVLEGDVVELDHACGALRGAGLVRLGDGGLVLEDVGDAARADDRAREDHRHEGAHHDRGEDLQQVLQESGQ